MKKTFYTITSLVTTLALIMGVTSFNLASAQTAGDDCEAIATTIVSSASTMVNGTSSVAVDNDATTTGNQVPAAWTAIINDATWIWDDAQHDGAAATGTETFTRTFNWTSDATTSATLYIAADNTYVVRINGDVVASSSDENNFSLATQDVIDVGAAIDNGTNTIEIMVTNADNGSDNPAGLLYKLVVNGFDCDDVIIGDDDDDDDDDDRDEKVTICHIPGGNMSKAHSITVGAGAVQAHLNHGDAEGACDDDNATTTTQMKKGNRR